MAFVNAKDARSISSRPITPTAVYDLAMQKLATVLLESRQINNLELFFRWPFFLHRVVVAHFSFSIHFSCHFTTWKSCLILLINLHLERAILPSVAQWSFFTHSEGQL